MEKNLFEAYIKISDLIQVNLLYSLIAGIVITFLVFKIIKIVSDSLQDGKGFSAKLAFELGKEYIFVIAVVTLLPVLFDLMEKLLYDTVQAINSGLGIEDTSKMTQNMWKTALKGWLIQQSTDLNIMSFVVFKYLIEYAGKLLCYLYEYMIFIFLACRYMILILLKLVFPIAFVCILSSDTRNSFYTWIKSYISTYLMYPALVLASAFSDRIVLGLMAEEGSNWNVFIMLIFSLILKTNLLNVVRTTIGKWL